MKYAETPAGDSRENTIRAKPWLALIALACAVSSVMSILGETIPALSITISAIALSGSSIFIGGLSIRQQLFEKTAGMGVFISVTTLIALAGLHLQ